MSSPVFLVLLTLSGYSGIPVELTPHAGEEGQEWLSYDNGTPAWITWGGAYRGVWFNLEDFMPGAGSALLSAVELWFYHHSDHPWDTSDIYVEIWSGDASGPQSRLDRTMITALHNTPVYLFYDPAVQVPANFWVLLNTEFSAGGWPSTLGDGMQGAVFHSLYSSDFILWQPWDIGGACNYLISALAEIERLSGTSWGALKSSF